MHLYASIFFVLFSGIFLSFSVEPESKKSQPLSAKEKKALLQMREEEKMARDVYLAMYDLYGMRIFSNIASSEQVHMDEVLRYLNAYQIPDPASDKQGEFRNSEMQQLYDQLVKKGKKSLADALWVGATIEDLDIYDLQQFMVQTKHPGIQKMYSFLNCGSRNHMRAFSFQLSRMGVNYWPAYILADEYEAIINNSHERCGRIYFE